MLIKNNLVFRKITNSLVNLIALIVLSNVQIQAHIQKLPLPSLVREATEDFTWQYIILAILFIALIGTIIWVVKSRKKQKISASNDNKTKSDFSWERDSLDADKEMEWLRKNQLLVGKRKKKIPVNETLADTLPQTGKVLKRNGTEEPQIQELSNNISSKFSPKLPIFSIKKLDVTRPFIPLAISNDPALMSAIEQTHDEMEEDEEVREIALRILNAFKTRNSVESLAEIALYDLSANLRSRAVTILSDFDHESVFESILLACADPTREVRAAAARGLFRLSFDRSHAWLRIAETEEEGRMIQAARAAIEGDLVKRSLDRLVHHDRKIAFEAVALVALLIKTGEIKEIFNALETHTDINVRKAILQVIKITKDKKALEGLYSMLEKNSLSLEFQEEIDKTIEEVGFVTV